MARLVAIADDLSGAADCAAACAPYGMIAIAVLHGHPHPDLAPHWPKADVVSIDANTRGATAEQAARTTAILAGMCRARSAEAVLFKKVDSTLRGNLVVELAAVLRACREASGNKASVIILAPALPAQGRTTIGGHQMAHGRLLEETDLWKNEARPPRSNISEVLAEGGLSCCIVDIAAVRAETAVLTSTLAGLARGVDVLICDAETDEDLRRTARAAIEGGFSLWAGSAGLAAQFPRAIGLQKRKSSDCRLAFAAGPTLIVVGSAASISREQASALAVEPEVVSVRVPPQTLLDIQNKSAEIVAALQRGRDALIILGGDKGWSEKQAQMFAGSLSDLVKPCANLLGGLVATGGETARAILDGLAVDRLQLLGEVEPGVPFSVAEGWERPLPVLTKAGAFGSSETLIHCREFLRNLERAPKGEPRSALMPQEG